MAESKIVARVPDDPNDAVAITKQLWDENVVPFWCTPLIWYLESRTSGYALNWAIDAVCSFDGETSVPKATRLEWITWLKTKDFSTLNPPDLFDRSRQIWYWGGTSEPIQRATARLYEAVGCQLMHNEKTYRQAVDAAIVIRFIADGRERNEAEILQVLASFLDWSKTHLGNE